MTCYLICLALIVLISFFYCVLLCNHWLVSYVDPPSDPLPKLLSIWARLNHCWPHALSTNPFSKHHKICFLVAQYFQSLIFCSMKIGCVRVVISKSSWQKLTWPPNEFGVEWNYPKKCSLSRSGVYFINPSSSWCRNNFSEFSLPAVWLRIFRRGNKRKCPVIHKFILKLTSLTLSLQLPRKQIYAQTFLTDPFLAS